MLLQQTPNLQPIRYLQPPLQTQQKSIAQYKIQTLSSLNNSDPILNFQNFNGYNDQQIIEDQINYPTFSEIFLQNDKLSIDQSIESSENSNQKSDIQLKQEEISDLNQASSRSSKTKQIQKKSKKITKKINEKPQKKIKKDKQKSENPRRNAVKNIGNQMIKYILQMKYPFFQKLGQKINRKEIQQIKDYLKSWDNKVSKIEHLRTIWTGEDQVLDQNFVVFIRAASRFYLRKECVVKIMQSNKLKAKEAHLYARAQLLQKMNDPYNFYSLI